MGVRARVITSAGTLVDGLVEADLSLAVLTAYPQLRRSNEVSAHDEVSTEVAAPAISTLVPGLICTRERVNLITRIPF